jgi:hypothetical protein
MLTVANLVFRKNEGFEVIISAHSGSSAFLMDCILNKAHFSFGSPHV